MELGAGDVVLFSNVLVRCKPNVLEVVVVVVVVVLLMVVWCWCWCWM